MDIRSKLSPTSRLKLPPLLSLSSEALSKFTERIEPPIQKTPSVEVIPRFDWIQKTSELSIYFYTKGFCNPGIFVEQLCDKEMIIKIFIANTSNSYKFSFLKSLKWPCFVKINQETGKIEMTFEKTQAYLWTGFGTFERTRTKDESSYSEFIVESKKFINHDSFEIVVRPKRLIMVVSPIGKDYLRQL